MAICGYHGWHDWYLATNLKSESALNKHLLPGLEPKGVPDHLSGTVHPFEYNDFDNLESIISNENIGVIIMEVMRNREPQNNFLEKVRKLASKSGIVLIFDECTSGFRETHGGLHLKYGVYPDMAMFGKALGNGYAITSVIGRREVMEYAQSSFISSTFWTERIGSVAALATLNVMEETRSWETVTKRGQTIKENWEKIAKSSKVEILQSGLPALASFSFKKDPLMRKTFFSQEMLKQNFLASNSFYASLAHTDEILDNYFSAVENIFDLIGSLEDGGELSQRLEGSVCHGGFRRLN